jgi:sulfonate transport system substrate-binding protein
MLFGKLLAGLFTAFPLFCGVAVAAAWEPLRVANQKAMIKVLLEASGELADVPYRIEFSEFPAAAPLGEALNAGAVDIGGLGDAPYVFALGTGAPLKVVEIIRYQGRFTTAILVSKDAPLKTVAQLKGKRIATNRGSIGHYLLIKALHEAGLQTSQVSVVNLFPADARSALLNGEVDAWSTWDPYTSMAITQHEGRILRDSIGLLSSHLYFAATQQAVTDKRPQLEDFVKRVERAFLWVNHHHRAYAEAQSRVSGLPVEVHEESARGTQRSRVEISDEVIRDLQKVADLYLQEGVLSRAVDVSEGFDSSFNSARPTPPPTHP